MKKPKKSDLYYFTDEVTFTHPLDNVHYFLMDNYEIGMHKQSFFAFWENP